jgi:hypothetical protein
VFSRHLITQLWMWMSNLATKISPMVATNNYPCISSPS